MDVPKVLFQKVANVASGVPNVREGDSRYGRQISNVHKLKFLPMFLCDMFPPLVARVDSRYAKFRAANPPQQIPSGAPTAFRIKKPNGDYVVSKASLLYLRSFLCDNGSTWPELNRRVGAARAEFETLCRVWNHAVLPTAKKIRIFEACVLSKLLLFAYSMA